MADEPDAPAADVKPDAVQEPAQPAPSTEEAKAPAKEPAKDKPEGEDAVLETLKSDDDKPSKKDTKAKSETDKPKEEPEKDKAPEEVEKPEEKPEQDKAEETKPTKADERKSKLNTEIRDLVAQRNSLRTEIEKINSEVYQPATEEELVEEGLSATDAKVEALRQQIEVKDYNERVAEAQLTIESESVKVLNDFDWTNPDSPNYKEELSNEAAQLLQANLITDPNTGQVIGSNISPYQLYKTLDRASGISTVEGQLKGQQDTQTMLANADTAGSAAPPTKAKDPILDILKSDDY